MTRLERILLVLIGLALALGVAYWLGLRNGAAGEKLIRDTRDAKTNEQHALALGRANERADLASMKLRTVLDARERQHEKEKADALADRSRLLAELRSGRLRLSVPILAPGAGQAGDGAAPAAEHRDPARAELDPAAAHDLVAIVGEGDDAIRQLNACIDAYEAVRLTVNEAASHAQAE